MTRAMGIWALVLAAIPQVATAQEAVRSGLRLGLGLGFSLSPPPVCQGCIHYQGMGVGGSLNLGWAVRTDLAVDLAATGAVIHFADGTDGGVAIYDLGGVGFLGRNWLRVGAGAARWDAPVLQIGQPQWRRWGSGVSVGLGRELGTGRIKLGIGGRFLVGRVAGATLTSFLVLCDLSRS